MNQGGGALLPAEATAALERANAEIARIPVALWLRLDLKTIGSIAGAYVVSELAEAAGCIVNPIEKGHPDIVPPEAAGACESVLRRYPVGLEVKGTCGSLRTGTRRDKGRGRLDVLAGLTWQAHHREVGNLFAFVWDFVAWPTGGVPQITAAFHAGHLTTADWGGVSGTTARSTKVCGLSASGRRKLAASPVCFRTPGGYRYRYLACLPNAGLVPRGSPRE